MKVRYTYKLRPGSQAVAILRDEQARSRWLWNECVHQFRTQQGAGAARLDKLLTQARANYVWLREGSSVVQQQTIRNYCEALNASFRVKGRGRPKVKTKKSCPRISLNYTTRGFRIKEGRLVLAGGISIPLVWSRALPSTPTSVRVYEDAAGWWWASFVVEVQEPTPLPKTGKTIGVDWGVKTTATTSNPAYDAEYQPVPVPTLAKRKKAQKGMGKSGNKTGTKYQANKKRAAKAYRKEKWRRKEQARAWAQHVARNHDQIAVEDFKPKFLAKSTMARKAATAAIGQYKSELIFWGGRYGRDVRLIDPKYTTMDCSSCGARAKSPLGLSERVFECWSCGLVMDRDRNSAAVMVVRAGFTPADVEDVNPASLRVSGLSESAIPRL